MFDTFNSVIHVGPTNYNRVVAFRFLDLFAGIGGFHAALSAMGGQCVDAVEIDQFSSSIYQRNWGLNPFGDVTEMANDSEVNVPDHDVLVAGFPCQPFSKSGAQMGMEETRGTLFWNILKIVQTKRPALVMLENVRNLAGPRHIHEWEIIIRSLREEGYEVCETPNVLSPHLLPRELGGRPQVRERVFIVALRNDTRIDNRFSLTRIIDEFVIPDWNPNDWNLQSDLPLETNHIPSGTALLRVKLCGLMRGTILWKACGNCGMGNGCLVSHCGPMSGDFPQIWIYPKILRRGNLTS